MLNAAPVPLFDGKTFTGWEGRMTSIWRIEQAEIIAGTRDAKQPKNDFLCTTRDYADFDLRLEYKRDSNNGGVQFRSERVPGHHEVKGYQADFAPGIDGFLYDESRRKRFLTGFDPVAGPILPPPEGTAEAVKRARQSAAETAKRLSLAEWNHYRIRAEGPRIRLWINHVLTADYLEADPTIPRTGKIALQIHGGATEIRYRRITIEELNGSVSPAPLPTPPKSSYSSLAFRGESGFKLKSTDTVALIGGSNIERTRFHGFLQTHLIASPPGSQVRVRNFGWEGDTVFEQWRDGGVVSYEKLDEARREAELRLSRDSGTPHWRQQRNWQQQLAEVGANVVLAQFGQMESLGGREKLPAFIEAYDSLLTEFAAGGRRLVLISPLEFERTSQPHAHELMAHNDNVKVYAEAIRALAARRTALFVDLSRRPTPSAPLTDNGFQLNEHGHRVVATVIAEALGATPNSSVNTAAVRTAVLEMERLWFDHWRPMNWAFLAGDRTTVPYSLDWRDRSKRIFPEEMKEFPLLLQQADENIWHALAGRPTTPIPVRSSIPVEAPTAVPQSPEEQLASFTVLAGFKVNLFASEADGVVKPIQMRWDERGRLWIACAVSYPQIKPGEKANDYVLVCEDTDGDGRADKFHRFVEGLFMPSGLELGDGGLYVAQGTELLHFRDTNGDGKADTKRIVLGGFGTADSHQMINGISWGFGGELWFTQGHHIYSRVETPFGVETLNRAGVWRLRPRTLHLDPFFQWSSAGANCWGVTTDDYGQPFHKSGANVGAYFSTPGLVRSDLAVNSQSMNIFTARIKQVGMEIVGTRHLPEEMQGRFIIGGYYNNTLEQHELRYVDGTYTSTQLPNLIETKNNVFRPIEVRGGPDGAIYVADWYNAIIGHYQASYRHPDRDKSHGRIWRITHQHRPVVQPASLAGMSVAALFEQLDSPERWAKYQTKRLLFERETKEVIAALDSWVAGLQAGDPKDEYRRLQALSVFEAHETPRPALLESLLRSPDARIRAYATRTLSTWARNRALPNALALLETQVADEDARVRLEAIVAASYLGEPRAAIIAARALDHPFNAYHQHALTKTLHVTHPLWARALIAGSFDFDQDEHLLFALKNGWMEDAPDDFRGLSGGPTSSPRNAGSSRVSAIMRRQLERHEGRYENQAVWLKALATVADVEDVGFIFDRGGNDASVLSALAGSPAMRRVQPRDSAQLLEPLLSSSTDALRVQAVRLAGIWRVTVLADRIRALATDGSSPLPLRKAALTALGDLGGPTAIWELRRALEAVPLPELQAAAMDALVTASPQDAAQVLLTRFAGARDAVPLFLTLLARTEGNAALIRALDSSDVLSVASAKLALQALNTLGRPDPRLARLLMKHAGLNPALPAYTKDYVARVVRDARTRGNAVEGKKIYEQTGCIACHVVDGAGGQTGPDLSVLSRGMPIDMIVAEVVWPALNVKEGYETATANLRDGTIVSGFKQTDTAEAIAIRDLTTGEVRTIRRADTIGIQTGGTVMPDGMVAALNEQQLAHLIRYLSELGR